MTKLTLEKDVIIKRVEGIETELAELEKLAKTPLPEFSSGDAYKLAQYHLHRALEGIFNISSHILSRIPGAGANQYREIAQKMGEVGVVPTDFANTKLVEMAKYRNRLVHFYAEISPEEIHKILQENLSDIELFLKKIKELLENPQKFNLEVQ